MRYFEYLSVVLFEVLLAVLTSTWPIINGQHMYVMHDWDIVCARYKGVNMKYMHKKRMICDMIIWIACVCDEHINVSICMNIVYMKGMMNLYIVCLNGKCICIVHDEYVCM